MQAVYFDLDGTLAALYDVPQWLEKLHAEDATPYAQAKPLVNMVELAALIVQLRRKGFTVGVISWGAMGGSTEYTRQVKKIKRLWCNNFGLSFDEFHVVKYGTPKHRVAKIKNAVLVDDNEEVRTSWSLGQTIDASDAKQMIESLKKLAA